MYEFACQICWYQTLNKYAALSTLDSLQFFWVDLK